MHEIYGLANPTIPKDHPEYIFYVGQTKNPVERLGGHLARPGNEAKDPIIKAIYKAIGQSPIMILLEEVPKNGIGLTITRVLSLILPM